MSQAATTPPVMTEKPHGASQREVMGHPIGLYVLFSTELFERFSFYSMRAFLVLYMTKVVLMSQKHSSEIYGAYLGFVYAAPFVGGMLADRLLGQRRAITIGAIFMAVAQFSLAAHAFLIKSGSVPQSTAMTMLFFLGLGLLSTGNGFFKPNISSIVGGLYQQSDARRDGAFTIFYMGINIGAFLAGISGQVAQKVDWYLGFVLAGVGMLASQFIFLRYARLLGDKGLPPRSGTLREPIGGLPKSVALALGVAFFVPLAAYLMSRPEWVQNLGTYVSIPILAYLIWEAFRGTREERGRIFAILVLCSCYALFSCFFELAGSAINLFTDQHVERQVNLFGWSFELTASFLTASTNPLFIILLGFPFAKLWLWLNKRRMEPSSPLKFALGLLQLALGFFVMYLGAIQAGTTGKCNLSYLIVGFFLHTTGELCLSPVGLSTMTKLSPARLVSTIMGVWFLAAAMGNVIGGWVGGLTENKGFGTVFYGIAITITIFSVVLLVCVPLLKKLMHGVK
jgi:proton-dependent oligopeptide transporter, POT family